MTQDERHDYTKRLEAAAQHYLAHPSFKREVAADFNVDADELNELILTKLNKRILARGERRA